MILLVITLYLLRMLGETSRTDGVVCVSTEYVALGLRGWVWLERMGMVWEDRWVFDILG